MVRTRENSKVVVVGLICWMEQSRTERRQQALVVSGCQVTGWRVMADQIGNPATPNSHPGTSTKSHHGSFNNSHLVVNIIVRVLCTSVASI